MIKAKKLKMNLMEIKKIMNYRKRILRNHNLKQQK